MPIVKRISEVHCNELICSAFVHTILSFVNMFQWRSPHSLSVVMKLIQHSSRALYIFQVGEIIFSGRVGETAKALQTLRTLQQNLRPPTEKLSL